MYKVLDICKLFQYLILLLFYFFLLSPASNVNIIACITMFYINSNKYIVNLLYDIIITSLLFPTFRIMITFQS